MLRNPYPIIEVNPEWVLSSEEMGTKDKFWYRHPSEDIEWLFKYPRPNSGEHWAEKIAAEIADLLDISSAKVELATYRGRPGSATQSFATGTQDMMHGNELLTDTVAGYDPERKFRWSHHTIENIFTVLDGVFADTSDPRQAKLHFAEYLILDALIGNTDRHHENWGVLRKRDGHHWSYAVAPSFDHASSLGRELQKDRLDLLLEENRVGNYVERGRGGIFWSSEARYGPSPLQLVRCAAVSFSDLFRPALQKTERLDRKTAHEAVYRVPENWMSPAKKAFVVEMITYSHGQLRRLRDE